jgi:hypothetical protein
MRSERYLQTVRRPVAVGPELARSTVEVARLADSVLIEVEAGATVAA